MIDCPPRFSTPVTPGRPNRLPKMRLLAKRLGYERLGAHQEHALTIITEMRPDGTPWYNRICITTPRQVGKSEVIAWLPCCERLVDYPVSTTTLWNAQAIAEAQSMFLAKIMPRFEQSELWEAAKMRSAMRALSGPNMRSELTGSSFRIVSTGKSSGHGQSPAMVVWDEAWSEQDDTREAALRPAMRAQPHAQFIVVSTAGDLQSHYLRGKVDAGRTLTTRPGGGADGRVAYIEWSAPDNASAFDRKVWRAAIPGLNQFISEEAIQEELDDAVAGQTLNTFKRMALNQWVDNVADPPFPWELWNDCLKHSPGLEGKITLAIDAAPERTQSHIVACDGDWLEVAETGEGVDWLKAAIAKMWESNEDIEVVVGAKNGPVAYVLDWLEEEGIEVERLTVDDLRKACGVFFDAVYEGRLRLHANAADLLRPAVAGAERKPNGGAWVWARRDMSLDVSALWAVTLAWYRATLEQEVDLAGWFNEFTPEALAGAAV